ncbi:MAG: ABC transporter permease [Thermomicrobiales bacterium]|nr:ABC transporter permease [Thermomicrobiales bacterium]
MQSGWTRFWRKLFRSKLACLGLIVLVTLTLIAIFSPQIAPYDWKKQSVMDRFQTPSSEHWLGTDELGRDILSRIMYGARYSLVMGVGAVVLSFIVGVTLGAIAGFYRKLDSVIMRLIDIMMAFPGILLAIAIVAALGPGLLNIIIAIGINEIPGFARITRSLVLSLREREFVTAARVAGSSGPGIVRRHIFVNLVSPITVYASLQVSTAVLVGATLSFLGLGIQPPIPEWGTMVSTAREYLAIAPHTFIYPTLAIFITVISFNLLGDGLRDALDPTT